MKIILNIITIITLLSTYYVRAEESYTIHTVPGQGGVIKPGGDVVIPAGGSQLFFFVPNYGYHIENVLLDSLNLWRIEEYYLENVRSDHVLEARFEINKYEMNSGASPGGTIEPFGTVVAEHGDTLTYFITPNEGYEIKDVRVDGKSYGKVREIFFDYIDDFHYIFAEFRLIPDTFRITASAHGNGEIIPDGIIKVREGDSVRFDLIPDDCYKTDSVLVDRINAGPEESYTFSNVEADHSIDAFFSVLEYEISASTQGKGRIEPDSIYTAKCGSDLTYGFYPDEDSKISEIIIDDSSFGKIENYTFHDIRKGHSILAIFKNETDIKYIYNKNISCRLDYFSGDLEINLTSKTYSNTSIEIFDSPGERIYCESIHLDPGLNSFSIRLDNFPSGIYFILIRKGNKYFLDKFCVN